MALTEEELDKRLAMVTAESKQDLEILRTFEVVTADDCDLAAQQRLKLKSELETIEKERRSFVDPLNDVVKRINLKVKPATTFLDTAIKLITASIAAFQQREEERQQKALQEAQAKAVEGDVVGATLALARVESEMPKIAGLMSRDDWDFEIIDESKIPRQFLQVNMVSLRAFVRATKKENAVPGVRSFIKKIISQRGAA